MTISVATAASRISANAAAVATAMASGTTTAEATALANLLDTLAKSQSHLIPVMILRPSTDISPT
jgi:hypothetical protein